MQLACLTKSHKKLINVFNGLSLTEFGLLKHNYCEKYILEPEDGEFYHSGIDGSLFTSKYEKFYTNNEFCVDFFYFKEDDVEPEPEVKVLS